MDLRGLDPSPVVFFGEKVGRGSDQLASLIPGCPFDGSWVGGSCRGHWAGDLGVVAPLSAWHRGEGQEHMDYGSGGDLLALPLGSQVGKATP